MNRLCVSGMLALAVVFMNHEVAASDEGSFVTVEELKKVLRTRNIDQILEKLNDVKSMRYQGEILPLVDELWLGKGDRYPDFPLDTINLPIIKVEFANILLQAERNGRIKTDRERIYRFVEPLINSSDVQLSQTAIFTLSLLDQERTAKRILAVAEQENRATFRMAVVSLSWMCDPSARQALEYLGAKVKSDENKSIVREALEKVEEKRTQSHICNSR